MNDFTRAYMRGYKDAQKEALMSVPDGAQPAVTESHKQRSVSEHLEPVAKVCHDLDGHIGWNPKLTQLPDEGTLLYITPPHRKPLTDEEYKFVLAAIAEAEWMMNTHMTECVHARDNIRRAGEILEKAAHGIKE